MNEREFEEFIRRNPDLAMRLIVKAFNEKELLTIGNRSYIDAFKYPESYFDPKDLVQSSGMLQPLRDPSKLFTDYVVAPASYIIFQDDAGRIYAKNGKTGQIEFFGTDASKVIQNAINALAGRGKIFIKIGSYNLSSPIQVSISSGSITIEGEGPDTYLSRNFGGSDFMIKVMGSTGRGMFILKNLTLWAVYNNLLNPVIDIESTEPDKRWIIDNIRIFYGLPALRLAGYVWCGYFNIPYIYTPNSTTSWTGTNAVILLEQSTYKDIPKINHFKQLNIRSYSNSAYPFDYALNIYGGYNVFDEIEVDLGYWNKGIIYISGWSNRIKHFRAQDVSKTANTISAVILDGTKCVGNWIEGFIPACNKHVVFSNGAYRNYVRMQAFGSSPQIDATGAGSDNMVEFVTPNLARTTAFTLTHTGNPVIYRGYRVENSDVATFSGDGTTTQFKIAHGLASTPKSAVVTPASGDAKGTFYVTVDATYIYVNYATAPPAGTNNVVLYWYAKV